MGNFGLITCSEENYDKEEKLNLHSRLKLFYKRVFFKRSLREIEVTKTDLFDNTAMVTIKLPFRLSELEYINIDKTERYINESIANNGLSNCIIPDKLMDKLKLSCAVRASAFSKYLFFSLLKNIIDIVTDKKGLNQYELAITIIAGENRENLKTIVEYIAPYIKFLVIVRTKQDFTTSGLDDVLGENGLSALITDNMKGALKDASIVINLAELDESVLAHVKPNQNCTVINYGKVSGKGFTQGSMINGIKTGLPSYLIRLIDRSTYGFIMGAELAEIIISHKLDIQGRLNAELMDLDCMNRISKEFTSGKYHIYSFIGRHGLVDLKNFK